MPRVGSILAQHVQQKIKAPFKYRRFAEHNNNNLVDFNQIINSKFIPFPINDKERIQFMEDQKAKVDLTFLEKSYKKMSHKGVKEVNQDNLMIFSIIHL